MALAVLGDDAEAGEGTSLAGDVEGRVPTVVGQQRVGAGLQEPVDQLGLLCDDGEVEGGLCRETHGSLLSWLGSASVGGFYQVSQIDSYLSLVVLSVEEGVAVRQLDHLDGVICGFVDDGQVEKPVRLEKRRRERFIFVCLAAWFAFSRTGRGNGFTQVRKNKAPSSGAFRKPGLLLGNFHQLWL